MMRFMTIAERPSQMWQQTFMGTSCQMLAETLEVPHTLFSKPSNASSALRSLQVLPTFQGHSDAPNKMFLES
jgi:hypothetical protein